MLNSLIIVILMIYFPISSGVNPRKKLNQDFLFTLLKLFSINYSHDKQKPLNLSIITLYLYFTTSFPNDLVNRLYFLLNINATSILVTFFHPDRIRLLT